jgi:anti-sigma regulatory factor (Ser/Thr protein kinase)
VSTRQADQGVATATVGEGLDPAGRRLAYLLRASQSLSSSLDLGRTAVALADLAVPELADGCAVHLVQGREVLLVAAAHIDHGRERVLAGLAARREPTDDDVARRVADRGEPELDGTGRRLWVPVSRDERPLGVLSLSMEGSGRPLGRDELPLVEDLVRLGAVALDHALRYRELAREARTLQRSLLPASMPVIPGIQLAARYRAAGDGHLVSGDFLDIFPVGDDTWDVAVGDVAGRGVQAATLTSLVRHTARVAAETGAWPSEVLTAVDRAVSATDVGERFATMALARLRPDPAVTEVHLALAGHPQPLLVAGDGAVTAVGTPSQAIGVGRRSAEGADDVVHLAAGDALVLLTDGLGAARAPAREWLRAVRAAAGRAAGQDAAGLAASLEEALLGFQDAAEPDDLGLVVLRVPTAAEAVRGTWLHERLPAEPIAAYVARNMVRPWLDRLPVPQERRDDVVLVVSELVTNAARSATEEVGLRLWRTRTDVVVEVADDGDGFVPSPESTVPPAPHAEAGRGLWLVQMLADDCQFSPGPWGTVVRCRFATSRSVTSPAP